MKYNRQHKFSVLAVLKTLLLLGALALSAFLCYSCLQLRQTHLGILNRIEAHKTQISDIEALSRANKEVLKNLRSNIEADKASLGRLAGRVAQYAGDVQAEKLYYSVQQMHKQTRDRLDELASRAHTDLARERQRQEQLQRERAARLSELAGQSQQLRDEIGTLKRVNGVASNNGANGTNREVREKEAHGDLTDNGAGPSGYGNDDNNNYSDIDHGTAPQQRSWSLHMSQHTLAPSAETRTPAVLALGRNQSAVAAGAVLADKKDSLIADQVIDTNQRVMPQRHLIQSGNDGDKVVLEHAQ